VGTHLRAVFAKLGVQSRVQLANQLADPLAMGAIGPRQAS
jgi:DNA-binding CsgD family transcriptional regulator